MCLLWTVGVLGVLTSLYYLLPYYLDPYDFRHRFQGPWLAAFSNIWLARAAQVAKRHTTVDEMHKKYGTFVRIAPDHISIADPTAFEAVYGHSSRLLKTDFYNEFFTDKPDMFTTQDKADHAAKRKRVAHIFSSQNVLAFEPRIQQHVWQLCQQWDYRCYAAARGTSGDNWKAVDGRAVIECTEQFGFLAFDVIGDLALGSAYGLVKSQRDNVPLKDPTSGRITNVKIVQSTFDVSEIGTEVATWPAWFRPFIRILPWNYSRSKSAYGFARLTTSKLDEKLERVKRAAEKPEDSIPMVDIVDKLLEIKDGNGNPLARREIFAEASLLLFAGGDTTSSSLGAFCYYMAIHRDVQQKIQAELDNHIPLEIDFNDDGFIDTPSTVVASYEQVKNLPYLSACIKEVMRIQSVVGMGLPRVVPPGQTFAFKGQTFKAGSVLSVPSLTVNQMNVWGPDAESFIPERWLGPEAAEYTKYHSPFSFGTRACIGRNLAMLQVLIVTATLLRRYDIVLDPFQPLAGNRIRMHEAIQRKLEQCNLAIKWRRGGDI